jgi:hypothetical protein
LTDQGWANRIVVTTEQRNNVPLLAILSRVCCENGRVQNAIADNHYPIGWMRPAMIGHRRAGIRRGAKGSAHGMRHVTVIEPECRIGYEELTESPKVPIVDSAEASNDR